MSADSPLSPTPWQTVGPFFHFALTDRCSASVISEGTEGERITLVCHVLDGDNAAVSNAMLEFWQADAHGRYNRGMFTGFARLCTDPAGSCSLETIIPGCVPGLKGSLQAPHINVSVFASGLLNRLVTRIYFAGNPANDRDEVLAMVPDDRRGTLMAYPDPANHSTWKFDIRLCSDCETVFFDV